MAAPALPLAELRRMLAVADALGDFDPALVCEDWFIGPNGSTVRDTAQMFYFAQAAAQELGPRFRPVMHATWKAATLGSARLSSDDAARALFYNNLAVDAMLEVRALQRMVLLLAVAHLIQVVTLNIQVVVVRQRQHVQVHVEAEQ
jgi:hypothetical protein